MVESAHGVTAAFASFGYSTERHDHRAVDTGLTNAVAHRIRTGEFSAAWIQMPIAQLHVRKDRYFACMSQICLWARLCQECRVPLVIFGLVSTVRRDPQVEIALGNGTLTMSFHRMCHFGLKVDATQAQPSSVCFAAARRAPPPTTRR